DDEPTIGCHEIHDIGAERNLPAKFDAIDLAIAEPMPEPPFGIGRPIVATRALALGTWEDVTPAGSFIVFRRGAWSDGSCAATATPSPRPSPPFGGRGG